MAYFLKALSTSIKPSTNDKDKPARGNFSLVWKRIDGEWKIVHDHSSLLAEPN